ncbi:MAG: cytochrome-c peroxidase [Bacteroidota bacterium]
MKRILFFFVLLVFGFRASDEIKMSQPKGWPEPEINYSLNSQQIQLGRMLFYDPVLSADGMVSCASCHSPYNAFAHTDHALSHGIRDQIGTRNAPALMNLAWRKDFMWDGSIKSLNEQIAFPINHPLEMGSSLDSTPQKLINVGGYTNAFEKAFGDPKISTFRITSSISQFILSLMSASSKYDKVLNGQTLFNSQESKGYALFKKNCSGCHSEPLLTTNGFGRNNLPINSDLNDEGRYAITKDANDYLNFRIPTLRNIEHTYPYMHDGRFKSLWQVMDHYNTAGALTLPDGRVQEPIVLKENEKVDLMAFLLTLTDKDFLFNPDYGYPTKLFQEKNNQTLNKLK